MSDKIGFVEKPRTTDFRAGKFAGFRLPPERFGVHVQQLGGLVERQEHGDTIYGLDLLKADSIRRGPVRGVFAADTNFHTRLHQAA